MQEKLRQHIEKIIPLSDDEFSFVLTHLITKKYKKHQFLIQVGEPVKYHYFVVSGLLKLVYTDDTAKQHIVSFAMEDWWESDFYAFYTQTEATMSLECIEDTEVYCLSLEGYRKLCRDLQKMERFFLEKANYGFFRITAANLVLADFKRQRAVWTATKTISFPDSTRTQKSACCLSGRIPGNT
jgi:CRP-like cAMP-binding protein